MSPEDLLLLPLWYAAFLLSITCHEAAHAFVASRGGDPTASLGGQVSLNPVPHIRREIFGTVVIPLLTYVQSGWMMGWASAPYDPAWARRHPRRAAAMAAAGPAANLLLALLALAVLQAGLGGGLWAPPPTCCSADQLVVPAASATGGLADGLGRLCSILLTLNVLLFLFNLVPLPPLDGAAVVAGLVEATREPLDRLRAHPLGALAGILLAWWIFGHVPLTALLRDWVLHPGLYGP